MSAFNLKDFIQTEDGRGRKIFEWCGIRIVCERYNEHDPDAAYWSLKVAGINGFAEDELRLDYQIGAVCNRQAVAKTISKMFNNKYKDAYHKTIKGVLNGSVIGGYLYLGIKK